MPKARAAALRSYCARSLPPLHRPRMRCWTISSAPSIRSKPCTVGRRKRFRPEDDITRCRGRTPCGSLRVLHSTHVVIQADDCPPRKTTGRTSAFGQKRTLDNCDSSPFSRVDWTAKVPLADVDAIVAKHGVGDGDVGWKRSFLTAFGIVSDRGAFTGIVLPSLNYDELVDHRFAVRPTSRQNWRVGNAHRHLRPRDRCVG